MVIGLNILFIQATYTLFIIYCNNRHTNSNANKHSAKCGEIITKFLHILDIIATPIKCYDVLMELCAVK